MQGFFFDQSGNYYEGDQIDWRDQEVAKRPSPNHQWINDTWVEVVPVPESITPLQGLRAINAVGLSGAFTTWANSPDRTFLERAFIDKAQTWRRDDDVLIAGAAALGLSGSQLDDLFIQANQF